MGIDRTEEAPVIMQPFAGPSEQPTEPDSIVRTTRSLPLTVEQLCARCHSRFLPAEGRWCPICSVPTSLAAD